MRGTIALDIDGTIKTVSGTLSERVASYLATLAGNGWRIAFITGRPFTSAHKTLNKLGFVHYIAAQNGSVILEMPQKKVIFKNYLQRGIFAEMEAICRDEPTDFVVYSGIENDDHCYFRPEYFSPELFAYLEKRWTSFEEVWHPLESYDLIPFDEFPAVKCFGHTSSLVGVAERIEKRLKLHVPIIRDPFADGFFVAQATHPLTTKGQALKDLIGTVGERGVVIAAGDDYNDVPMLEVADIRIVMNTAPIDLLAKADIIAPSAEEEGIITGLEQAIQLSGKHSAGLNGKER